MTATAFSGFATTYQRLVIQEIQNPSNTWFPGFGGVSLTLTSLFGGDGNDALSGGTGDDSLYGGEGMDGLYAGDGNDVVQGDQGNDTLFGGSGNDKLFGGADNDDLFRGDGNDDLFGGANGDHFVFDTATNGTNTVLDFQVGFDSLTIEEQTQSQVAVSGSAGLFTITHASGMIAITAISGEFTLDDISFA